MSRGKYAGQPLSFHCPSCFVMDVVSRRASSVTLTGRTKARKDLKRSNYHNWGSVAREYRCMCGHVGWSRHPDLGRWAGVDRGQA